MITFISSKTPPACSTLGGLFALTAFFGFVAQAKTGTSGIRGQALDPQSKGIPDARITLSDENNRVARSQIANASGEFSFAGLRPAAYRLEAEAPGFKKLTIERVIAPVNVTTEVPVRLEVGEVTQTVTVPAGQ
jgi:hypothetical protein